MTQQNPQKIVNPSSSRAGEQLKKARELKSLSVEDVHKKTHIHADVIVALEEGRCGELLSVTYCKSFMKKYAEFLQLDSAALLNEAFSTPKPVEVRAPQPPQKIATINPENVSSNDILKMAIVAAVGLVILVSIAFLSIKIFSFITKPRIVQSRQVRQSTAKQVKRQPVKPVQAKAPVESASKKKSVTDRTPIYLTLKVKQNVLVKVKKDGTALFERVLPKGAVETFKATEKIELYVSRAENIELILNGRSLGSPGRGVIRDLEITKSGIHIK